MKTYGVILSKPNKKRLKEAIRLARVCAKETSSGKADITFITPDTIRNIPGKINIGMVLFSGTEISSKQERTIRDSVRTGTIQVVIPVHWEDLEGKVRAWFPPITSCPNKPSPKAV